VSAGESIGSHDLPSFCSAIGFLQVFIVEFTFCSMTTAMRSPAILMMEEDDHA
jgi:hypothetical protein